MAQNKLIYKHSVISWYRFGAGAQPVLCFHGYGEQGEIFSFLEKYVGGKYSFYAIELPFHGKTEWNEGLLFTDEDLQIIVKAIIPNSAVKIFLLGFSLGGRVALSLYQKEPEKFSKLILLAPDGLKVNFWYWLSTQTWIGSKIFHFTMQHPGWFFGFLKLLNKLHLVNPGVFKFVKYYIDDKSLRELLFNRWITLRRLKPDLKKIKKQVITQKTLVRLVYGSHDRIILPTVGDKFRTGIEDYCTLTILDSGHQVLHEKFAPIILALIAN